MNNNNDFTAGFSWRRADRSEPAGGWLRDMAIALAIVLAAAMLCMIGEAHAQVRRLRRLRRARQTRFVQIHQVAPLTARAVQALELGDRLAVRVLGHRATVARRSRVHDLAPCVDGAALIAEPVLDEAGALHERIAAQIVVGAGDHVLVDRDELGPLLVTAEHLLQAADQLPLLGRQAGQRRRDRRSHDRLYAEMR